jgi:hypothetical protein
MTMTCPVCKVSRAEHPEVTQEEWFKGVTPLLHDVLTIGWEGIRRKQMEEKRLKEKSHGHVNRSAGLSTPGRKVQEVRRHLASVR